MTLLTLALTDLIAYLIGAVPFGYLVARAHGVDILRHGSGNIGATNVGRVLGRRLGFLVFALDFAKGAVPVLLVLLFAPADDPALSPQALAVTAAVAAFLGHLFPVYLSFRGGKGVATGLGIFTILMPVPALLALLAWLTVVAATRAVSLASIVAAATLCLLRLVLTADPWSGSNGIVTGFCLLAASLAILRHRANISRLLQGTENRLPENPAMFQLAKTLHVLAVGLWFGTVVFFSLIVGLQVFPAFEREALKPAAERPLWFPYQEAYAKESPGAGFPDPLIKEQGSRAAGVAVSALFPWYYGLQLGCAAVALVTAYGWRQAAGRGHRLRLIAVLVAFILVAVGLGLERYVEGLRGPRNDLTDRLLTNVSPTDADLAAARGARAAFGMGHGVSLLVNFAVLALVTLEMALCARLPNAEPTAAPALKIKSA